MVSEPTSHSWHPGIRPRPSLWRRLDILVRSAAPFLFLVFAVLVLSAPLGLPGQSEILFGVVLSSVFFWSVFRPGSMPSICVFVLGLLMDLVGFMPMGILLLIMLIVHGIAISARYGLMRTNFLALWAIFALIALGASLFQWVLLSVFSLQIMAPVPCLFQAALATGIYPLLSSLYLWAYRTVADPGRA